MIGETSATPDGPARWNDGWRVRTALLVRSLLFWTGWFAAARALFFAWHWDKVPAADRGLVLQSFLPGARMDLSAAAYITALFWLVLTVTVAAPVRIARRLLLAVSLCIVPFVAILTLTDIGTFGPWRRRLDAALWTYLASPREAYASAESIALGPLLGVLMVVLVLTAWAYHRVLRRPERALRQHRGWHAGSAAVSVGLTGLLLAIPIRGGLQWTPINESTVYFSRSEMANLGALNAAWYLLYSTVAEQETPSTNPFVVMPAATAAAVVDSLYHVADDRPTRRLLRVEHPNVILIIWESFTAKVVSRLGGRAGVTPEFERWTHQGILFDSVFASGDRSAQGLVSILSGFPSIPKVAIMTRPQKAATLPQLGRTMQQAGYQTSFYYGGELAFANMKAYVLGGGFDRVTGIEAFAPTERNSKWGAHDHVVLNRALNDIPGERRPFFSTIFTLSSHEPFEVPVAPAISGTDLSAKFMNAHHYTDASIGAFLDAAARQPWWDSTLVVIIADHGSPLPEPPPGTHETVLTRHHIPMLWLGGALIVRDTVIHGLVSSTDVAPTLLAQVGADAGRFRWGRNVARMGDRGAGFVWFAHHDGFAFLDRDGWEVFDERAGRATERSRGAGVGQHRSGSALLQATFADYLAR